MPIYTKQSLQELVDLINTSNPSLPVALTPTNLKYGTPQVINPVTDGFHNTSIRLTAPASGQYIGSTTLTYRRRDFANVFRALPIRIDKYSAASTSTSPFKISDLLPSINAKYGLNLQATDIVDAVLPAGNTGAVPAIGLATGTRNSSATVVAAASSFAWIGSFTLYWVQAPQDISTMITVPSLETARVYPAGLSVVDPTGVNTVYVPDLDAYSYDWTDLLNGLTGATSPASGAALITAVAASQQVDGSNNGKAWMAVASQLKTNNGTSNAKYYTTTADTDKTKPGNMAGWTAALVDLTSTANQALYPEADYKYFNRVLVITIPPASTWCAPGKLYCHFNV